MYRFRSFVLVAITTIVAFRQKVNVRNDNGVSLSLSLTISRSHRSYIYIYIYIESVANIVDLWWGVKCGVGRQTWGFVT